MGNHLALALADDDLQPIHVRADPNGLAWDRGTLLVADGRSGAILRVDGDHHQRIATIDSGGVIANNRIGGVAVTPSGAIYVTRLGYGRAGAVFRVDNGHVEMLAGLPPQLWRLGVIYDADDHALYTTQFHKTCSGPCDGSILKIDLASGECSTVAGGFIKPVGVAKLGETLVVTDSRQRAVFRVDRGVSCVLAASLDRPDSVVACGDDSVLVTTWDEATRHGAVRQLWLDGRSRIIGHGSWEPRGVATDGDHAYVSARRAGRVLVFEL